MNTSTSKPLVVAIGGVDPSGGSGIARDAATIVAAGARPALVATAHTVQNDDDVTSIHPVAEDVIAALLESAIGSGARAVKLGMLHNPQTLRSIAKLLHPPMPVVLDPVLKASSGGLLSTEDLPAAFVELAALTTLVTPNLYEARALTGLQGAQPEELADAMLESGWRAVLITGGDACERPAAGVGDSTEATDLLATSSWRRSLIAPRVQGVSPRGTGCALASLIAVGLALGSDLEQACRWAKGRLHAAIQKGSSDLLPETKVWPHAAHPFE